MEYYRAEEEGPKSRLETDKNDHYVVHLLRIPANHYYTRVAYGNAKYLWSVGVLRFAEAIICPVILLVLAESSNMKIMAIMCSVICTFLCFVMNVEGADLRRMISSWITSPRPCLEFLGESFCVLLQFFFLLSVVAIVSPYWVMLLYASPLTSVEDEFNESFSFGRHAATKCFLGGITCAVLGVSVLYPGLFGIDFKGFLSVIVHDAMHKLSDAPGILAIVKLSLMCAALASIILLGAVSYFLQGMRDQWVVNDRRAIDDCRDRLSHLLSGALRYREFFAKYDLLDQVGVANCEDFASYELESPPELGCRVDPAQQTFVIQIMFRKVLEKIYGDERRPRRILDSDSPDFDFFEDLCWDLCRVRGSSYYLSPSSISEDIKLLVQHLPNTSVVLVPGASAILKVKPLVARLNAIQHIVGRFCMFQDESELGSPKMYSVLTSHDEGEPETNIW